MKHQGIVPIPHMYREFSEVAAREGFTELSRTLARVAEVEKRHENRYLKLPVLRVLKRQPVNQNFHIQKILLMPLNTHPHKQEYVCEVLRQSRGVHARYQLRHPPKPTKQHANKP